MKKKYIFRLLLFVVSAFGICACSWLEPVDDFHDTFSRAEKEPSYAEGLLLNAYSQVPTSKGWSFNDVATDDAVTNDQANDYLRMASGQWTPTFTPTSQWMLNRPVLYLNKLLSIIDLVPWNKTDSIINRLFISRLKGEALALRGILRYYMLQDVAGISEDGELLGIQLIDDFLERDGNFNISRASFKASVKAIQADFDSASHLLPLVYKNCTDDNLVPVEFNYANKDKYNIVMGDFNRQRIQKRIINCFRSRLALLEASKAYNPNATALNDSLWVVAAQASGAALQNIVLNPNGNKYFEGAQVNSVPIVENDNNEMAWRTQNTTTSVTLEQNNFPPSLNGKGYINPTQNLVDAFPMADGFPANIPGHGQSDLNPYLNRDPRLLRTIIYHGQNFKGKIINVAVGKDKKDSLSIATRTGYYMKKLIREDITFPDNGTAPTPQKHYNVHIRFTEIFLNYAEAANEAGGPNYKPSNYNKTSKEIIAEIRKRAGITQPDNYLASIGNDQLKMRELIRNERRLELCFEGFRFFDLRRWALDLTESVYGVKVTTNGPFSNFEYVKVDDRKFKPYMQYSPVPMQEVIKYPALKQNAGWR